MILADRRGFGACKSIVPCPIGAWCAAASEPVSCRCVTKVNCTMPRSRFDSVLRVGHDAHFCGPGHKKGQGNFHALASLNHGAGDRNRTRNPLITNQLLYR